LILLSNIWGFILLPVITINGLILSMISLHMDDFTISSDSPDSLSTIATALKNKFEMTDDG